MNDISELLITSCRSTMHLWRGLTAGGANTIHTYKVHGSIEMSTLNVLGNDYIMVAEANKPLLHVWPITSIEENLTPRIVLPEPARVVAVSTDNCYLAVGIDKKLLIWQLCSGVLLTTQEVHLSPITCIKFSPDSDYLITGATNGNVLVYNFSNLVDIQETYQVHKGQGQTKPLYNKLDHISAVTHICIGGFSLKSRFATSSLDNTCRIYELLTGQLLLQLIYKEGISTFTLDTSLWSLYLGTSSGIIQQYNLTNPPRSTIQHVSDTNNKLFFVGHTQQVNCLALNITNDILVSGSEDKLVLVWDVESRQILNKLEHKSPITNIGFICSTAFTGCKPKVVLAELQRIISLDSEKYKVGVIQNQDITFSDDSDCEASRGDCELVLKDKLLMAYGVNERLYSCLTKMIQERDGVKYK
ncbi:hypothetical protein RN001_010532 [Aquatica leii]|uniref:Uncharacterized protein n=1 Tax=Aquatica leii TaxID=1421715 RepID=A0AAN7S8L9_9COLE|nr:hypothetical protein RN001_010532 [Aquatica leii]